MQHEAESLATPLETPDCVLETSVANHAPSATCQVPSNDHVNDCLVCVQPDEVVVTFGLEVGGLYEMTARFIGPQGRLISIECDDLQLAQRREYQAQLAEKLGFANVEFRRGRVQDLQLDLDQFNAWLESHPANTSAGWLQAEAHAEQLRQSTPLIAADSIDTLIGRQVLTPVPKADRGHSLNEIYRALKRGGRLVFSEIVSDEEVPPALRNDSKFWPGSTDVYREDQLLEALEAAGFYGIEITARRDEPLATIAGIEFRHMTVEAYKGKTGSCFERQQAVIYRGPWKAVIDDDGHTLYRGKRMAVCDKTFQIYSRAPYSDAITLVPPITEIPLAEARPFNCKVDAIRDPKETKATGSVGMPLLQISGDCGPSGCC